MFNHHDPHLADELVIGGKGIPPRRALRRFHKLRVCFGQFHSTTGKGYLVLEVRTGRHLSMELRMCVSAHMPGCGAWHVACLRNRLDS